jgi:nucleolar protein 14
MDKEQGENVRQELDSAFGSLRELLFAEPANPSRYEAVPGPSTMPGILSTSSNALPSARHEDHVAALGAGDADYDTHVRELAFDKRAKAKDRTKTEEELALEEKEALEKAERRRRKRMLGLDDSDDEAEVGKKRKKGADDLDDDFELEGDQDWGGVGPGLGDIDLDQNSEASGSMSGSGDEDEDGEDEEDEEDEESYDDDSDAESVVSGDQVDLVPTQSKPKGKKTKSRELPFTFPCPSTHDEFLQIVDGVQDSDIPVVVQRIRTLYHTSLSPDNKFKLQVSLSVRSLYAVLNVFPQGLATVLIDHILYLAAPPSPRLSVLSSLLPHLLSITETYPVPVAEYFSEKLSIMHKNLRRGLTKGALNLEAKTWPTLPELSLLRVIGSIWSTSDMNHAIITPTRLLIGAYIALCRVRSLHDIASGLYISTLFLQYEQISKRYMPEVVNFLVNTLLHLGAHTWTSSASLPGSFPTPDFDSELCRPLKMDSKQAKDEERMSMLDILSDGDTDAEAAKKTLFDVTIDLLDRYADQYKSLESFNEVYTPILDVLTGVISKKLGKIHQVSFAATSSIFSLTKIIINRKR